MAEQERRDDELLVPSQRADDPAQDNDRAGYPANETYRTDDPADETYRTDEPADQGYHADDPAQDNDRAETAAEDLHPADATAQGSYEPAAAQETDKSYYVDPATEAGTATTTTVHEVVPAQAGDRWRDVQAGFVDDPRAAVERADDLVQELLQDVTRHAGEMRERWKSEHDTEQLRLALREYRGVMERLMAFTERK